MSFSSVVFERAASAPAIVSDKATRLYVLRSLLSPLVSARWTGFIRGYHRAFDAAPPAPRVLAKPLRRYVHAGLGPAGRLDLLRTHYRLLRELFSGDCVRRLCGDEPTVVAELAARKGEVYRLVVAAATHVSMQREGELAFYLLKRGGAAPLSRLSLTLGLDDGRLAVMIGGLQGPAGGCKREVIEATRALYGLRPKDAVVLAARAFAKALGAPPPLAIANRHHVAAGRRDGAKHADYDSYWLERGAAPGGPLGFVFAPLEPVAPLGNRRNGAKASIVAAVERFVRREARRAGA